MVAADVDGDGDQDVILGNNGADTLLLNDGNGGFTDASSRLPARSDNTWSIDAGDVDGDGDVDLVLGNFATRNRLYLNDGSGSFADVSAAQLPLDDDWVGRLELADVDADGDLDLYVAVFSGTWPYRDRLYANDGAGTFTDVTASQLPNLTSRTFALGDLDADGDLDLFSGHASWPYYRIALNDGTGVFATRSPPLGPRTPQAVALVDVDENGVLDAVISDQEIRVLYNDGAAGFVTTANAIPQRSYLRGGIVAGDVDPRRRHGLGDGDPCSAQPAPTDGSAPADSTGP